MRVFKRYFVFCFFVFLFNQTYANVTVTPASGGGSLCASSYTTLGDIVILEGANGDIAGSQTNVTLILTAPSGYQFNPGVGSVSFTGTSPSSANLTAISISVVAATITVTLSSNGTNKQDQITITGIQVQATTPTPPAASGNILRTAASPGTATIAGIVNGTTNFGTLTQSALLAYSSSAVTQANTSNVPINSTDNEIIGIQVVVSGNCGSAPSATSFSLNTTGSTDAANDLTNATIYYTGTSSSFATTTLVGSYASPNGSFVINGSATLSAGTNYFWLAYDVSATATLNNVIDGECTSVTVGSAYAPSPTTIAGSRTVGIITITSNGTGGGNWNAGTSWTGGIAPTQYNHAVILSGDAITLTANAACIDLTVNGGAGGTLNIGTNQFTISGNLTVTSPGAINTTSNSQLVINDYGGKSQFTFPTSIASLLTLTLNRTNGATSDHNLQLDINPPADSIVLVLTNGVLSMTAGSKLLLNNKAIKLDIPSSDAAYIDGIVSRQTTANSLMFLFPVGGGGISRRFSVAQSTGADGIHEVQFMRTTPINSCCINFGFLPGAIINEFYWKHTWVSGGNPQRRIYYQDGDFPGLSSAQRVSALTLANNKVTDATTEWRTPTTGWAVYDGAGEKYVQFNGANASNAEYWTFGSTDETAYLPITLLYFNGVLLNHEVVLKWATATEINNDFFTVEKSYDGVNFYSIGTVKGAGNSTALMNYTFIDGTEKTSTVLYYRLKQTDFDGKFSYSEMIAVKNKADETNEFFVFSNSFENKVYITSSSLQNTTAKYTLTDLCGRVLQSDIVTFNGTTSFDMNNISSGLYLLTLESEKNSKTFKISK